jgi:signal transduction histidine kinase
MIRNGTPPPPTAGQDLVELEEVVRSFPAMLETLRASYGELEERAGRVDRELCLANEELERKVHELDVVKRHLEAVLESLPCGVVVRDAAGSIQRINGAVQTLLGVESDELLGRLNHAGLQGEQGDGTPREMTLADGRRLVLASRFSEVSLSDGSIDGSVEILDDRTERTALLERLHAADKMAALGTMAAGIAHEIRNPLGAVRGFAGLLDGAGLPGANGPSPEKAHRWAALIMQGVDEVDAIIQNMLTFGSPERLRMEAVDGAELLRDAVRLAVGEESASSRGLIVNPRCDAPPFLADQIKLRQAIRNLVANASDVQPEGGRIDLLLTQEDDEIVIRVTDAGPGIPDELRGRILDPFFTTHADGTGLGLALVSTIAQLHGGAVTVGPNSSELGGADIRIRLPYQPAATSASPSDSLER